MKGAPPRVVHLNPGFDLDISGKKIVSSVLPYTNSPMAAMECASTEGNPKGLTLVTEHFPFFCKEKGENSSLVH